jgi:hypothetical protein
MFDPTHSWDGTLESAREVSKRIAPWVQPSPLKLIDQFDNRELWKSDVYKVVVQRLTKENPLGNGSWAKLAISSLDGLPRHDWRDMQFIKHQLVGEEWEALELYPAYNREVDPSNQYLLYAFPKIPIGIFCDRYERHVLKPEEAIAPQRGWA